MDENDYTIQFMDSMFPKFDLKIRPLSDEEFALLFTMIERHPGSGDSRRPKPFWTWLASPEELRAEYERMQNLFQYNRHLREMCDFNGSTDPSSSQADYPPYQSTEYAPEASATATIPHTAVPYPDLESPPAAIPEVPTDKEQARELGYLSMVEIIDALPHEFSDFGPLTAFLKEHPMKVREFKPSGNRRMLHVGDLLSLLAEIKKQQFDQQD